MRMTISPPTLSAEPSAFRNPHFEIAAPVEEGCRTAELAALSTDQILSMSREELIEVIRAARGRHLRPGVLERLPQMDLDTLQKLVFLTRRYCRNQQLLAEGDASPSLVAAYCG